MGLFRALRIKLGLRRPVEPDAEPKPPPVVKYNRLSNRLWVRAIDASAEFVEANLSGALIFPGDEDIRPYALQQAAKTGMLLEFGVYEGGSISAFARSLSDANDPRPIFGFDAFRGLGEDWTGHWLKKDDAFNRGGRRPDLPANVTLVEGWIEDTLPKFLQENPGPFAFVHIDTDTYAPCSLILRLCADRLVPGTLILFDELLSYPGWRHGEFKALTERLPPNRYRFRAFEGERALIEIIEGP